ncbi:MAG: prepilin-type N-terminal cleavage/methylation domain-containing protein [Proteobacteria bacterium]|nr:prepilin-type N-terminal cleavage/methylation domain-containing protein [Pseudomonadota bacterium]
MTEKTNSLDNKFQQAGSGFTLFEVLVAIAIIGIVFTSVFKLHGQTIAMSYSSRFYTIAPMLCQKKLSDIEREDLTIPLNDTGDFGEEFPGYVWHATVDSVESEALDESFELARIDVTVALESEGLTHVIRAYRYRNFKDKK